MSLRPHSIPKQRNASVAFKGNWIKAEDLRMNKYRSWGLIPQVSLAKGTGVITQTINLQLMDLIYRNLEGIAKIQDKCSGSVVIKSCWRYYYVPKLFHGTN
ncbi:hypothetical protein CEXT_330981 [Caerostris extrusa]|uniref:Uncharacterized protein n=1 Tax=Caerostris extrusa TaxID=172846 RepID=A0AAV4V950_CAEEX|nr:hypothetical protein CEXT_330981 [Caerostris extrusa]